MRQLSVEPCVSRVGLSTNNFEVQGKQLSLDVKQVQAPSYTISEGSERVIWSRRVEHASMPNQSVLCRKAVGGPPGLFENQLSLTQVEAQHTAGPATKVVAPFGVTQSDLNLMLLASQRLDKHLCPSGTDAGIRSTLHHKENGNIVTALFLSPRTEVGSRHFTSFSVVFTHCSCLNVCKQHIFTTSTERCEQMLILALYLQLHSHIQKWLFRGWDPPW